jgi:glycosyltransferase involved in cell wall biosynthesis
VNKDISVVHVNAIDIGGGAAKVAWDLFQAYKLRHIKTKFVVAYKNSTDQDVLKLTAPFWERANLYIARMCEKFPVGRCVGSVFHALANPQNYLSTIQGKELFSYPSSRRIFDMIDVRPDIVHCHNLHGKYFDLRFLPKLSKEITTFITLHDAWLLSGHCAHSYDCERWREGCGNCPYLSLYPSIKKDASMYNWKKKKAIYQKCKLYVATPSQWLMKKVESSILVPAIVEARVVYNGVDTNIFYPEEKKIIRKVMGIDTNAIVLLFVAHGAKNNQWKDFDLFKQVVKGVSLSQNSNGRNVLGLCVGDYGEDEILGKGRIRYLGYVYDTKLVAQYYNCADLYIHASKVDTFPSAILEALACGIPVIATNVGGISEQIKTVYQSADSATGILVNVGDGEKMIEWINSILGNKDLYKKLSHNALIDARMRFSLKKQVDTYLQWYDDVINLSK